MINDNNYELKCSCQVQFPSPILMLMFTATARCVIMPTSVARQRRLDEGSDFMASVPVEKCGTGPNTQKNIALRRNSTSTSERRRSGLASSFFLFPILSLSLFAHTAHRCINAITHNGIAASWQA